MDAEQVQLDGELLDDVPGMRRKYGPQTAKAIEDFRKLCAKMVSPVEYYEASARMTTNILGRSARRGRSR